MLVVISAISSGGSSSKTRNGPICHFILIPGCTAEQFACADLTKCIAIGDTCNYENECDDGSDELPLNIACGTNRFFIFTYLRYLYFKLVFLNNNQTY